MIYNTSQEKIVLKEYGRNIQNIVEHLKTIEDRDKRSEMANVTIELMKQIAPAVKETIETNQKLWDDLYIISNFELDVDCPFPTPSPEILDKKPDRMPYANNRIKYKHYGLNLELLVQEALKKEDPEEREAAIIYIGKLMKSFYASWNKDGIEDIVIVENIRAISNGKLTIELEKVQEGNLFEKLYKSKARKPNGGNGHRGGQAKSKSRRRRRN